MNCLIFDLRFGCFYVTKYNTKKIIIYDIIRKNEMVTGVDNTKKKKKSYKSIIERDTELLQGGWFGGAPEHVLEENKKRKQKRKNR